MTDPDTGLDALVAAIKDIPALVTIFEDADNIRAYKHDYPTQTSRFLAIYKAVPPTLLVCYVKTEIIDRSRGIGHYYAAYLKPRGNAGAAFKVLREGIVTSSGKKLKLHQVDSAFYPPDVQGLYVQTHVISDDLVIDYHEVPILLAERGVDI